MSYRGRLIWPFLADIRRLDTSATAANTGGVPGVSSGYDPDYREPVKLPGTGDGGPGIAARVEYPSLCIPCQVEIGSFDRRTQSSSGNIPKGRVTCVFHFRDLEEMGLVETATGAPVLRVSDRLAGIYTRDDELVQTHDEVPLFASEVQPSGFGLRGHLRNLLIIHFDPRDQGANS